MMEKKIYASYCSALGYVRAINEDNLFYNGIILERIRTVVNSEKNTDSDVFFQPSCFAVFDGIGGEDCGEEASYTAACVMMRMWEDRTKESFSARAFLNEVVEKMNFSVVKKKESLNNRMGTTYAGVIFADNYVYACNVGDSKVFRLRDNELLQMSEDHSDAVFLEKYGVKNRKPSLSQYIGVPKEEMLIEPHLVKAAVETNDVYLLCTDGLTDMVSNANVCNIMNHCTSTRECSHELISSALTAGGRDNVTVIVIYISGEK